MKYQSIIQARGKIYWENRVKKYYFPIHDEKLKDELKVKSYMEEMGHKKTRTKFDLVPLTDLI